MSAPLGYGQELFWQLDNATPDLIAYNVPRAFRIRGALNADALEQAFNALVQRHDVLRSVYALAGDHPEQHVLTDARVPFERAHVAEAEIAQAVATRSAYHFDLSREIPLRASLLTVGDQDHVLFFLTHHIVSDGWSKSIMFRELGELYAAFAGGREPALEPMPLQFADYARRERAAVTSGVAEETLAYWRGQLKGPLPVLELPTDFPRPTGHTFEGDVAEAVLPKALVDGMRQLGQKVGASLYMVLLAAYQTLLHRYTGQSDIITGSPTAGREAEDVHGLIGYFAGALVMRNSFGGNLTFTELLERVANTALDAYEHQDIPFELLVHEVQKGGDLTHAPLFQHVLTMEDTIPASLVLGDAKVEPLEASVPATKFDLTLLFSEHEGGLRLRLQYRTALFTATRAERLLGHLRTLLEAAIADPTTRVDALPLLTAAERTQLVTEWNATAWNEGEEKTVVVMAEAHASRSPDHQAVVSGGQSLTWSELNARANRVAHWLVANGAAPERTVGVCLDRSVEMIVALLGVLKSGAAFVPLVPDLPPARLAEQVRESGALLVVTDAAHASRLPESVKLLRMDTDASALEGLSAENSSAGVTMDSLAYVLFTSGSTGVPKGVAVTHGNIAHYTRAISRVLGVDLAGGTPWHFATVSTLGADLGHTAVFPALCSGGTLHVLSSADATDPSRFAAYVARQPLDVLKITPNHFRALVAGAPPASVMPHEWLVFGGEACPWDLAEMFAAAGLGRVLNHYGPTETTVGVCTYPVMPGAKRELSATVPIGRPLANTRAYVLDASRELVPVGVPGELYIGGRGVTRGYLGREDLTRERFVADPFASEPNGRLYRTGDRVRRLDSGAIEFLGRADEQVKVRGYRVELGEIEQVLRAHPGVGSCAVVLHDDEGGARLVAFVVAKQAGYAVSHTDRATPESLTALVADRLPEYMVPSAFVFIEELPLTANGKLDKAELRKLEAPAADAYVAPESGVEVALATIWSDILKRERIGRTDSFIALGGQSLLAIRVLGRISKQFGVRLPLRTLFDAPTIAELAVVLEAAQREKEEAAMLAALAAVEGLSDADAAKQMSPDVPGKAG